MKEDPKKQCDPKFRVKRTHSSKDIEHRKPVQQKFVEDFPKSEMFDRFRIFSEGTTGTLPNGEKPNLESIGPKPVP
jgi:hypothetical protein